MSVLAKDILRAFRRTPYSNLANLLALVLGFTCFLGAWVVVAHWQLANHDTPRAERIVAMTQQNINAGNPSKRFVYTSRPLAKYLQLDFPELETVARLREPLSWPVSGADWKAALDGSDVDPEIVDLFDIQFIHGDKTTALATPDNVVLARSIAERYYGDQNPVGETLLLRDNQVHTVTGVIEDIEQPSFFGTDSASLHRFDFLRSWPAPRADGRENWVHFTTLTYVLLPEAADRAWREGFEARLETYAETRMPSEQWARSNLRFGVIDLDEMAGLVLDAKIFKGDEGRLTLQGLVYGLGALVLIVAALNYIGLATALSALKAREIGLRKVLGAGQGHIAFAVWMEALVLTLLAGAVAIGLIAWAAPLFDRFVGVDVFLVLAERPYILVLFAVILFLVSVAVSLYPAVYLTRMLQPVDALRLGQRKSGPKLLSATLVGLQFFFASALLIVILIMSQQNAFLKARSEAPTVDPVAVLMDVPSRFIGIDKLKAELASEPSVKAISTVYFPPWGLCCIIEAYTPADDLTRPPSGAVVSYVGADFFNVFETDLLAGRVFEPLRDMPPDEPAEDAETVSQEQPVLIDETMARKLGFARPDEAVGKRLYYFDAGSGRPQTEGDIYRIIGVVEAVPLILTGGDIRANIYQLGGLVPVIRVDPGRVREARAAIEEAVETFAPNTVVDIQFTDTLFARGFQTYQGFYNTIAGLAAISFLIAAIGLLAMATFAANRRRHEIGVRKTLGARTDQIILLLVKDFSVPILIGNLVAWPVAWLIARGYLQNFMDQVSLTISPFILGLLGTLAFAWLVIGAQAFRAARTAPIDVLRGD